LNFRDATLTPPLFSMYVGTWDIRTYLTEKQTNYVRSAVYEGRCMETRVMYVPVHGKPNRIDVQTRTVSR